MGGESMDNKEIVEKVKASLTGYVERVAGDRKASPAEVEALPAVAEVLLEYLARYQK